MMTQFQYVRNTVFHPFDTFWELKFEKKGRKLTVFVMFLLYFIVMLFERQFKDFLFNMDYGTPIDLVFQLELMIPFVLLSISNWSVTTLTNGKGTMTDIAVVVSYPLIVVIAFRIVITLLSRYLSFAEDVYLIALSVIGWGLYGCLVFIGLSVIHQYSFSKTIGTLVLTLCAAVVIVFICVLFVSLLSSLYGFVYSIYREMSLRL